MDEPKAVNALPLQEYWGEATRPLTSLAFVTPVLLIYECGLLWLGPESMRNGVDVWLRQLLHFLGFSQYFLLPLLTFALLLIWHHLRQDRWSIRGSTLYGMLMESLLLGGGLLIVAFAQRSLWDSFPVPNAIATPSLDRLVVYFGAGIYEELLFRLMLVPLAFAALRGLGCPVRPAVITAALASSLLFAAAHYQVPFDLFSWTAAGERFDWTTFAFRFSAGLFFSSIFYLRGFGVAVGTHTIYDLLVVCG